MRSSRRFLSLAGLLVAAAPLSAQQSWVQNPANGKWYGLTPALDWPAADAQARAWGGQLATVRSAGENQWIYEQFCQDSVGGVWLGLNDRAVNGVFVWSSGETSTFQAWDEANQHNTALEESCVHLQGAHHEERFRGRWNDLPPGGGWLGGLPGVVEFADNPDTDADGLIDVEEARYGAVVGKADTDGDGLTDGEEVHFFPNYDAIWEIGWRDSAQFDSVLPGPAMWSTQGKLMGFYPALVEGAPLHLDPANPDTDGDGLTDGQECGRQADGSPSVEPFANLTNPRIADSDFDGLLDGEEDRNGNGVQDEGETSATLADSDGDGLPDGLERAHRDWDRDPASQTDPNLADSDGGGLPDGVEDTNGDGAVQLGETDPLDPNDDRVHAHLRPNATGLHLCVHGLRRGAELRVLACPPGQVDEAARAASGNPLETGLGVALELTGTPILVWQGLAHGESLHLDLRGIAPGEALEVQIVEVFANGPTRSSPALRHSPTAARR